MSAQISSLLPDIRDRLLEPTARFWTDAELVRLTILGIKDLWRDIVDLKQEHFLKVDPEHVSLPANSNLLSGVPEDVHKVYNIEVLDLTFNGSNSSLTFKPLDYNDPAFQDARAASSVDPSNTVIYYAITAPGAPVGPPIIRTAPQVNSAVRLSFSYCPTLGDLSAADLIPIPGEADNALVSWTVAYARAKEREDRAPDPAWLAIYATEKQHLLTSLGLREYQEPSYASAVFAEYW